MESILLKKSFQINNLKKIKFNSLWGHDGIFTTIRLIGKKPNFVLIDKHLKKFNKDILKKKNIVERNELQKDIDKLNLEIKKYRKKKKSFNDEINKKKLDYTKKVLQTMNPIISNYVEKNSITIVFDKKNVVVAKKELDITNPIMALLNNT